MKSRFSKFHPFSNFIYFFIVIILTCVLSNPFYVITSFFGVSSYLLYTQRKNGLKTILCFALPIAAFIGLFNMIFAHWGMTILLSVKHYNFTLESLLYGLNQGLIFASVTLWLIVYGKVLHAEKFLSILGKVLPGTALLLSIVLGMIPNYQTQAREIRQAHEGLIGRKDNNIKTLLSHFSALVSLALEGSMETADSMRARGYGDDRRKPYNRFLFRVRDCIWLIIIVAFLVVILITKWTGRMSFLFDPVITVKSFSFCGFAVFAILTCLPFLIDVSEDIRCRFLKSKI